MSNHLWVTGKEIIDFKKEKEHLAEFISENFKGLLNVIEENNKMVINFSEEKIHGILSVWKRSPKRLEIRLSNGRSPFMEYVEYRVSEYLAEKYHGQISVEHENDFWLPEQKYESFKKWCKRYKGQVRTNAKIVKFLYDTQMEQTPKEFQKL